MCRSDQYHGTAGILAEILTRALLIQAVTAGANLLMCCVSLMRCK